MPLAGLYVGVGTPCVIKSSQRANHKGTRIFQAKQPAGLAACGVPLQLFISVFQHGSVARSNAQWKQLAKIRFSEKYWYQARRGTSHNHNQSKAYAVSIFIQITTQNKKRESNYYSKTVRRRKTKRAKNENVKSVNTKPCHRI